MLELFTRLHVALALAAARLDEPSVRAEQVPVSRRPRLSDDRGQATTEYALVLLAAALVAVLVITWATAGGGAAKVGSLFDKVIDSVIDKV